MTLARCRRPVGARSDRSPACRFQHSRPWSLALPQKQSPPEPRFARWRQTLDQPEPLARQTAESQCSRPPCTLSGASHTCGSAQVHMHRRSRTLEPRICFHEVDGVARRIAARFHAKRSALRGTVCPAARRRSLLQCNVPWRE